jgi:hypothetical protein
LSRAPLLAANKAFKGLSTQEDVTTADRFSAAREVVKALKKTV